MDLALQVAQAELASAGLQAKCTKEEIREEHRARFGRARMPIREVGESDTTEAVVLRSRLAAAASADRAGSAAGLASEKSSGGDHKQSHTRKTSLDDQMSRLHILTHGDQFD